MFLGVNTSAVDLKGRFALPARFVHRLSKYSVSENERINAILIPGEQCLLLYPMEIFKEIPAGSWATNIDWNDGVQSVLAKSLPKMATPWYSDNSVFSNVREAEKRLQNELADLTGSKSRKGREVEKILKKILSDMGVVVESNIRVLGSEIDLLLARFDEKGKVSFVVIELKYRESKATVSQVMRLFGLQEVLKKYVNIEYSVIATSAGLTEPAKQITQRIDMKGMEMQQLFEWVDQNNLNQGRSCLPFMRSMNIGDDGRIIIPKIHQYLLEERKIEIVGMGDYLELWSNQKWCHEMDKFTSEKTEMNVDFLNALSI